MVRKTKKGGRFLLSENKIKEFKNIGLTSDSYAKNRRYYNGVLDSIIQMSQIKLLSQDMPVDEGGDTSNYGIIFKISLKDHNVSPFVKLNIIPEPKISDNNLLKKSSYTEVRTFLLKLSFIHEINAEETIIRNYPNHVRKKSVSEKGFDKETFLQNESYKATYIFGESVVPACLSPSYIAEFKDDPIFLKLCIAAETETGNYLRLLASEAEKKGVNKFGIFLMEFAEGFTTLDSIIKDIHITQEDKDKARILAKASHIILYNKQFVQGDCHEQNVMVNLNYKGSGKALIIDFGRAEKIAANTNEYDKILDHINLISNKRFQKAGQVISKPQYEWVKLNKGEEKIISEIINQREEKYTELKSNIENINRKRWNRIPGGTRRNRL